jgi:uncharacterized protein YbjT (DUF2867 family)
MVSILVTGGTGILGRSLVPKLLERGHSVAVATRAPREHTDGARQVFLDLTNGDGLGAAVANTEVIVHAATDAVHAKQVDIAGTAALLEAAAGAGVEHFVYPSIVGIDGHAFGYYRVKKAVEELIESSGVPYTIQRITQFHQFPVRLADAQRWMPIVLAPSRVEFQVLDVSVAAERLAQLVAAGPSGRAADLGGAEPLAVEHLIRSYLRARGSHRPVVGVRVPGATGRDFRAGLQLSDDHTGASPTWDEFLADVRPPAEIT